MDAVPTDRPAGALPRTVLLVEDNAIVAMNAEELLLEIGAGKVLVAGSVAEALPFCADEELDFALLDLNLGNNETSIPVAHALRESGVPFAFASGYGESIPLPPELDGSPILRKPYLLADLRALILGLSGGAAGAK